MSGRILRLTFFGGLGRGVYRYHQNFTGFHKTKMTTDFQDVLSLTELEIRMLHTKHKADQLLFSSMWKKLLICTAYVQF